MAKVNMMQLREDPPKRTVFLPMNPYDPHCDNGWTHHLADDEIVCPECEKHPCVDEYHSGWCRRCQSNGYIKIGSEENEDE